MVRPGALVLSFGKVPKLAPRGEHLANTSLRGEEGLDVSGGLRGLRLLSRGESTLSFWDLYGVITLQLGWSQQLAELLIRSYQRTATLEAQAQKSLRRVGIEGSGRRAWGFGSWVEGLAQSLKAQTPNPEALNRKP